MPDRQVTMNLSKNAADMLGLILSRLGNGIFENKTTNYEEEEKQIFEVKR